MDNLLFVHYYVSIYICSERFFPNEQLFPLFFSRVDRSNKGHILGAPQKAVAERDLSPAMVSLLRLILHSTMLAGGCRQPQVRNMKGNKTWYY